MLDINSLLDIKYFDSATYANMKVKLGQSNVSDTETITLDTDNFIYIGYYKPIKAIYLDFITPNTNSNVMTLEYYNGTEWTEITKYDATEALTRSGLIQWEELSDQEANTVDSVEKFWVRISTDTLNSEAEYNFIGVLFSDDRDIVLETPYILDSNFLMGQSNHLNAQVAARDEIVQYFRNKNNYKVTSTGVRSLLTMWDLLFIEEVKQASKFLALSKIYMNLSDAAEDSWMEKSLQYKEFYNTQINLAMLSLDIDDDGLADTGEKLNSMRNLRMTR